jgi:hypothetical protein
MKIATSWQTPSLTTPAAARRPGAPAEPAPEQQESVHLSGLSGAGEPEPSKGSQPGWGRKLAKGAAKTGLIVGAMALGGLTALGVSSIGASMGLVGLSVGLLAQLSSDTKVKTMGTLLMLGPLVGAAGVLGALGTALSVGFGTSLAFQYGAGGHQLANEILDRP